MWSWPERSQDAARMRNAECECGCQGVMGAREENAKCRIQIEAKGAPQKSETENGDFTFLNIEPRVAQKLGQIAECEWAECVTHTELCTTPPPRRLKLWSGHGGGLVPWTKQHTMTPWESGDDQGTVGKLSSRRSKLRRF